MSPKPVLVTTSSFGAADPQPRELLASAGLVLHENPHKRKLTEAEVSGLLSSLKPLGMIAGLEPLTAKVLEAAKAHLRVVSRCGIGTENVDLEAAKRLGIKVSNTPDAPSPAVAELAVGLMLSALRRIPQADADLRAGTWKAPMGSLLGDKTVGVVGHGRIGSRVAQLARAFGCRALAFDECDFTAAGVERVDLPTLLAQADVVSLHLPLVASTKRIVDAKFLAAMKKDAVLVNTSRGGLIDEAALDAALRSGKLGGAALDVFEQEPYAGPLTKAPNCVLTPHMGSAAKECRGRMEREAAENLIAGLKSAGVL